MTNPVILLGTQSNGETLPVQVDATGRLVAEGLPGEPGQQGEKGDPFTYEDFTPEQLEALQGPPGADGPNDLKPYGPEWSYLVIRNGEPTWIADGSEPDPPGPTAPAMLVDTRDQSVSSLTDYGVWSESETEVEPPTTWDTYCRQLTTWETPTGQKTGLGGVPTNIHSYQTPFSIEVFGGFEQVLEITIASNFWKYDGSGGTSPYGYFDLFCDSEHAQILNSRISVRPGNDTLQWSLNVFNLYITRPDIGVINLYQRFMNKANTGVASTGAWVQKWRLVDPAVYLMRQHVQRLSLGDSILNS